MFQKEDLKVGLRVAYKQHINWKNKKIWATGTITKFSPDDEQVVVSGHNLNISKTNLYKITADIVTEIARVKLEKLCSEKIRSFNAVSIYDLTSKLSSQELEYVIKTLDDLLETINK